ncbi:hypothetical protein AGABI2DRAFT_188844 [Agaricus bisporus var. bisporus H97]|uniref:hypothetical protein n=1 Tax=Agaricus bisporus var. bisporus (strain H97 / ATCC MYA-4626 / FGSC 10389) TaxID=936046 RepID=UPI00029F55E9|nr:hypothetical protein AGABI2DRAFT_188844 [Agaricus bisporus var. bisporus H97]EKV42309.1 hypothetical protein AGABI2DRAFT_188844 [Agaricus bisporus var. bisporus H97]
MLEYIRMPALRTLVWAEEDIDVPPSDSNSIFSDHLPSTLSVVQLQGIIVDSDTSIFPYFSKLSSIEGLIFSDCGAAFMDGVFSALGSEMCWVGNDEMPILPNLKSIRIGYINGGLDQANMLQIFRRTCSQPASESLLGRSLRLEFANHTVDWTPEFKEELIRMVEHGYQVDLWEGSKPVDWLPR